MNWLFPGFLVASGAVLLPLLLHLLRKRRTREIAFPSLRFLSQVPIADRRRHRLRRWLVLLLRCAALALFAAAFARPFFQDAKAGSSRSTIIVIDNSFSMQATDRWPELLAWAKSQIAKPVNQESVGVLLMNPQPAWLIPPTRDMSVAKHALESFRPGWHGTKAMPALRFAADVLAADSADERRIILVGDQQACGWLNVDFKEKLPVGVAVLFPPVSATLRSQAALWTPDVRRDGDRLVVRVPVKIYTGTEQRTIRVFVGEKMVQAATALVPARPGRLQTVTLSLPAPTSESWLRCELNSDDLTADDVVYGVIPDSTQGRKVLLDTLPAGLEADYLATACEALTSVPPGWSVHKPGAEAWPASAVAILRNDASFVGAAAQRLDAFLGSGGAAIILATGGRAQEQWLASHKAPLVARLDKVRLREWSIEHPLVAPLAARSLRSLVGWRFSRGWSLSPDAVEPLASWDDGSPALGELQIGKGRVLIAGFSADRRDGNWPVEAAFLPFIHRAVQYLFDAGARTPEAEARVGSMLTLPAQPGRWEALAGPAVGEPSREVAGSVTPAAPGLYAWTPAQGARRLFTIGLSPEESDPTPAYGSPWLELVSPGSAAPKASSHRVALAAAEAEQQQGLWWWCLAAVLLCATLELAVANRTTR